MALIFRTSSLANVGLGYIKNEPITYEEADGNLAYLLTNMSGSNVTIVGLTDVSGALDVTGPVSFYNNLYFWDSVTANLIPITANSGRLLMTASVHGTSSWAISASWSPATPPGGLDTNIQFLSGGRFLGTSSFSYYYASQSLLQGKSITLIGNYSHAEGNETILGTTTAFSASIASGLVILDQAHGNALGAITVGSRLFVYDEEFDNISGKASYIISSSSYVAPNTRIQLTDTTLNTSKAYVGDVTYLFSNGEFGLGNKVVPANYSHVEGSNNLVLGNSTHAEGQYSQAIGNYSHAEGGYTQAVGDYSHAEGNYTRAIGVGSHAEGALTYAIGDYSHTAGNNTVASGSFQSVVGQYNISSSAESAFIVGNGTSDSDRSNLMFASGSKVQIDGLVSITDVLTLGFRNPLPSGKPTGSVALSGSGGTFEGMYVYNGTSWANVTYNCLKVE